MTNLVTMCNRFRRSTRKWRHNPLEAPKTDSKNGGSPSRAQGRAPSPPARNVEQRAGHIGRRVADQPDGRLGDFLSRAWTSHRSGRAEDESPVRLASAGMNIGVDEARADGVDSDALGAEFLG